MFLKTLITKYTTHNCFKFITSQNENKKQKKSTNY